jgi:glutathione synthase
MVDVLFILDPPHTFDPLADSSYVMIQEAVRRGHAVHGVTLDGLYLCGGEARAHAAPLEFEKASTQPDAPLPRIYSSPESHARAIGSFDVVLMRKDPPVDDNFLTATWILDRASEDTLIINDPRGLRDLNEKLSMLSFAELTPPTRLLRRVDDLHEALRDFGGRMIIKPVFGFGGREVLQARTGDPNLSTLFELATQDGTRWTVAQGFVEEAREGDKRVLLIDGEPIGAVLRVPAPGELRDNFHAGGTAEATKLEARDLEICRAVGPLLREHGQYFAGIDVIGGLLTEINVTSPTGMQEINRLDGLSGDQTMQARFWDGIEAKLPAPTGA